MTKLYKHLQEVRIEAMKAKDTFTSTKLGTILGEAKQLATKKENRDPTDDEVLSVIKKGLEGLAEMLKLETDDFKKANLVLERDMLQKFMPTQLSELEIKTLIENMAFDKLGTIMAVFKLNFAGKYDGKTLKRLADEYLAQHV
jgi:uncharacterized protein YqeY